MEPVRLHLLRQLSDGRFHSGQQLATALGLSRTAIWKHLRHMESDLGLRVSAVRGRGYRLAAPLQLLDADAIRQRLSPTALGSLEALTLLASTPSTNSCAAEDLPVDIGRARVWLAEHQTAGRGRRGRRWFSAFGENLYLSLAWRFDLPMGDLAGLSLAAGVVVAESLRAVGLQGHRLKWPNDVLVDGRKLSGILVEAAGESGGPASAIIGVGVNFRVPAEDAARIDQPWTDLAQAGAGDISRNHLAGLLTDGLIRACQAYAAERLTPFLPRWNAFDALHGQAVRIVRGQESIEGVYRGVATTGAVVLEGAEGHSEHHAGEVSLRPVDA